MKTFLAVGGLLAGLVGFGLAFWFYSKCASKPPLSETVSETPAIIVPRSDTSHIDTAATNALISSLKARLKKLASDTADTASRRLLAAVDSLVKELDSLKRLVTAPPSVDLELTDYAGLPYIWPTVIYKAAGGQATVRWKYRHFWDKYPRFADGPALPNIFGGGHHLGIGFSADPSEDSTKLFGLSVGPRVRLKNYEFGLEKKIDRKGWRYGGAWFFAL